MTATHPKTITTIGTICGIVAGSVGMWFTLADRAAKAREQFEKDVETRVTKEIKMEGRLAKIEERLDSLKSEVWTQRTQTAAAPVVAPK